MQTPRRPTSAHSSSTTTRGPAGDFPALPRVLGWCPPPLLPASRICIVLLPVLLARAKANAFVFSLSHCTLLSCGEGKFLLQVYLANQACGNSFFGRSGNGVERPQMCEKLVISSFLITCKGLRYVVDDTTRRAGGQLGKGQSCSPRAGRLVSAWGLLLFSLVLVPAAGGGRVKMHFGGSTFQSHTAGKTVSKPLTPPLGLFNQ